MWFVTIAVGVMMAASAFSGDIDVAKSALRDGLWDVARTHAGRVPGDDARAVILESYAHEDRWADVVAALKSWGNPTGPVFDYYRAAATGDTARAVALLRTTGVSAALVDAKMLEAQAEAKAGNRSAAESLWREVVSQTNVSDRAFAIASVNLADVALLRTAYGRIRVRELRRQVGLRLGARLLDSPETAAEGERLVRELVRDLPDAPQAMETFLLLADAALRAEQWEKALKVCHEASETWPSVRKLARVSSGRGWALLKLKRVTEALEAFKEAVTLANDENTRALAMVKVGDAQVLLGRNDLALAQYRQVVERYPAAPVSAKLKAVIATCECEKRGREAYARYQFEEAAKAFAEVAAADSARKARMEFFTVLCLYGEGHEDKAERRAMAMVADCDDVSVKAEVTLWLAKYLFNRGEWKMSRQFFSDYAELSPGERQAPGALLWAARASLTCGDFKTAIQLAARMMEKYPHADERAEALLVQGEALNELARFDEAVLVLDRLTGLSVTESMRLQAQILRADALFAMGADNPVHYQSALEAYRALQFADSLTDSMRLQLAFKVGRVLEKLKRPNEAIDQYYSEVVIAYRHGSAAGVVYDDAARAVFSRAALSLADGYLQRGRVYQARSILELLAQSDVPAASEACKRLAEDAMKGISP